MSLEFDNPLMLNLTYTQLPPNARAILFFFLFRVHRSIGV